MSKTLNVEDTLPRSWELRHIGPLRHNPTSMVGLKFPRRCVDKFLDFSFTLRRKYRKYKSRFGYFFAPIIVGVPFCIISSQLIRIYNKRLQAGKIRYHYKAPERLRLPPLDIKSSPPWNDEVIGPIRPLKNYSYVEKCIEGGSRFHQAKRPAWQSALMFEHSEQTNNKTFSLNKKELTI